MAAFLLYEKLAADYDGHPVGVEAATRLAAPLLAGNTIIIKPPEQAPLTALELYKDIAEVFPPGVVNIVTGDGPTTGDALVRHPEVPRIAFIGSVETGRLKVVTRAHVTSLDVDAQGRMSGVTYVTDGEEFIQPAKNPDI